VSATSWALANLTVRRPVTDALDVGTGCGIQALLAARHAGRVTATDSNARALAFARFNAALNGVINVTFVEGDLFEPIAGERFDLVVANPPFVISPDHDYQYRDGRPEPPRGREHRRPAAPGRAGPRPGGLGPRSPGRLVRAARGVGCRGSGATPRSFSSSRPKWRTTPSTGANRSSPTPERHAAAVGRWLDYFAAEGIDAIGCGAVGLRRRSGAANWVRAHSAGSPPRGRRANRCGSCSPLATTSTAWAPPDALMAERFTVDEDHRLEQILRLCDGGFAVEQARLHLERALAVRAEVDA